MDAAKDSMQPPTINRILRLLRYAEGVSAKDLAKKLGISKAYVSALETGRREPTLRVLNAYGDCFGISPATLLYVQEENLLASNAELMAEIFEQKAISEKKRR